MSDEREIWFRRVFLWASTPIHWKGFVVLLIGVGVSVGSMNLGFALGHPGVGEIVFLLAIIWTFAMAERHMDRR